MPADAGYPPEAGGKKEVLKGERALKSCPWCCGDVPAGQQPGDADHCSFCGHELLIGRRAPVAVNLDTGYSPFENEAAAGGITAAA